MAKQRPQHNDPIAARRAGFQFRADLDDCQGWQEHADAYLGDALCALFVEELQLGGQAAVEDDEENRQTSLNGRHERRE